MDDHKVTVTRMMTVAIANSVVTSAIVLGELLFGLQRMPLGKRRDRIEQRASELFARLNCEPVAAAVADCYAAIKVIRERSGKRMEENDLWIAASALSLGATLVSRDMDYHGTSGLVVEDWSKPP
jgi:predicted nucleic acid-binding protein